LQKERVAEPNAEEKDDVVSNADAARADDLERHVHRGVTVEHDLAFGRQTFPVGA
jgi:hypothetical protein